MVKSKGSVDKKERKILKCDQCEYTIFDTNHVSCHIKGVHEEIKDKKCGYCNYATYYPGNTGNLKKHIESIHLKF